MDKEAFHCENRKMKPMEVLLVTRSEELKKIVSLTLIDHFKEHLTLHRADNLQDAIEHVEQKKLIPKLVLIEQKSPSTSMLKLFFALVPDAASVVIYADSAHLTELKTIEEHARLIYAGSVEADLPLVLRKFETIGKIDAVNASPDQYIAIPSERILATSPLVSDVYVSLPSGKYVKVFRKGDHIEEKDVGKYTNQTFHLTRLDCDVLFKAHADKLEAVANGDPLDAVLAKKVAEISQDLVRSLVADIGFTEEAQRIAKSSVNMSLKLIGSKPKLMMILQDLKKKEGNFVTSHSFLLGQLACAMAHAVGWNSATTYFKLSMAAFLHDISLNMHTHEFEVTYEQAAESGAYTVEELKMLRFHPTKAAEYTRQFSEIPADVEQIVAQHHERPDGTGYPRGLSAKYISPLSAIFILAHDMITFMMKHPEAKIEKFYETAEKDYSQSPFRKILTALRTETKIA
jgi:HD-GYP domain-containing protein (c-di-GMP phosphodiesterase class II)